MDKIGLFLCTGCKIGESLNLEELEELASENGASTYQSHECLCSPEGVEIINKSIADDEVNGVLIAACSPRIKTQEFSFDPTKVAVERTSLREHCVWSHEPGEEDTQMLAADLLRMGLAKVAKMNLVEPFKEEIERTVMVVGGGLTGLTAANAAASMGNPVVLVEASEALGGYLLGVKDLVPEEPPYDAVQQNHIADLVSEVTGNSQIKVILNGRIKKVSGQPGQYAVEMEAGETLKVGSIVQSTGARPYDATRLSHLGYGQSKDVITSQELEKMLKEGKLSRPSDKKVPQRVVFIQCAGSRDENHLHYCSSECCAVSLKQSARIRADYPDIETAIVYRDLRAPGQLEHFYKSVQEQGTMFTRAVVEEVKTEGSRMQVIMKESLLGDDALLEADLVVLAVGMVPNSADGEAIRQLKDAKARVEKKESETQVAEAQKIVDSLVQHEGTEILNLEYRQGPDLPLLKYGFPDSHYICFPYESRRTGIYAAGAVHAPMDVAQAIEDGWGAAMKAVQNIEANTRGEAVHPRAGDSSIASFFLQRCTQCKRCTEECPFGTINEDAKGTPEYNPLRCRRCGICLGACPERIISFPEYSVGGIGDMVKAIEVPDEYEEKPRIVALLCENDAYPALDDAAAKGAKWNPWVRIIPVRCLGACNIIWCADSLSRGIDGLILIGCKPGDDYQCHYMRGSELAQTRFGNLQETLERLALEPERVKILELSRNEFQRIPQELDKFSEELEEMGANPLKGF